VARLKDPSILIKGAGVVEWLEMLWKAWSEKFPQRAAAYAEYVKRRREQLWQPTGMSRDGTMAYEGAIPADIYIVITAKYPDFFNTPTNYELALKVFCGDHRPKSR